MDYYIVNEGMQQFKQMSIEVNKVGDALSGHNQNFAEYMSGSKKASRKQLLLMILALILLHYSRAMQKATKEWSKELEEQEETSE